MADGQCIAYTELGNLCRRPAVMLDPARGGVVCPAHAPKPAPPYMEYEFWTVNDNESNFRKQVVDSDGRRVALVCGDDRDENARLIAAAPELLGALRDLAHRERLRIEAQKRDGIHGINRQDCDCSECRDLFRAEAAIAKAVRA